MYAGVFFEEGNINKIEFHVTTRDLCHILLTIYKTSKQNDEQNLGNGHCIDGTSNSFHFSTYM